MTVRDASTPAPAMTRIRTLAAALLLLLAGCRGTPVGQAGSVDQREIELLVDSLMPVVAKATGLEFKATPRALIRTRDQVRAYLTAKLRHELPPERLDGIATTYRLLGLLPDTLDVAQFFVDLYGEQAAGFYDPDSTALYAVAGADRGEVRLVLAHELVHALQDQYTDLNAILRDSTNSDQAAAMQAVMEGQATLASMQALLPDQDLLGNDAFWENFRGQLRNQQGMAVYDRAPLVFKTALTFPYVSGADWMRWFTQRHGGEMPFDRLPKSTEQILHPDRYAAGDAPVALRFTDPAKPQYEDTFGELELATLRTVLSGGTEVATDAPAGWGGDRFRLHADPAGAALVWYLVWDAPHFEERFRTQTGARIRALTRPGYRYAVEKVEIGGKPGTRVIVAPAAWRGWGDPPTVEVR